MQTWEISKLIIQKQRWKEGEQGRIYRYCILFCTSFLSCSAIFLSEDNEETVLFFF